MSSKWEVDLCNIHQNGGLLNLPKVDFDQLSPITDAYPNKAVIFLDNTFEFFGARDKTISRLCDPQWLSEMVVNSTSSLFIGCEDDNAFERVVRLSVLPLSVDLDDVLKRVGKSHTLCLADELVDYVKRKKQFDNTQVSLIVVRLKPIKWYWLGKNRPDKQEKDLARHLRTRLPNERFLVSYVIPKDRARDYKLMKMPSPSKTNLSPSDGFLIAFVGHHQSLFANDIALNVTSTSDPNFDRDVVSLAEFGRYHIIATLPFRKRLDYLWKRKLSDTFVTKTMTYWLMRDTFQQIPRFSKSPYKDLSRVDKHHVRAIEKLFQIHMPYIDTLLQASHA